MTDYSSLTTERLVDLLDQANVWHLDEQFDACYAELQRRDAVPFGMEEDFESSAWYDDDAELESYSLECAFGPEE